MPLDHRGHERAEPVHDRALFYHEHTLVLGEDRGQRHFVVRLEEAAVHHGDMHPVLRQEVGGCQRLIHHRADREDRDVLALADDVPGAVRDALDLADVRWLVGRGVAWIADGPWTALVLHGRPQQREHLTRVLRRRDGEVRDRQQVRDVVQAHVRLAILPHEARAIHAQDDGERLQGDVVHEAVVRALEERGVDGDHWPQSARRQTRGEGHRVRFGDADVEEASRMRSRDGVRSRAARHRRGDGDDALIFRRKFREPLAEHLRVRRPRGGRGDRFAGGRLISRRQRVPLLARGMLACGKTLPLLRDHVNDAWTRHLAHRLEGIEHRLDVVTVDRPEVSQPELLEQHARRKEGFDAFLPPPHDGSHTGERPRRMIGQLPDLVPQAVVQGIPLDRRQVLGHGANVRRDGHLVVVEHDDQITLGVPRVVQRLVRKPGRQRAVAEHGDHLVVVAPEVASDRDAECRRDRRRRVAGAERVVLALAALEEARESALLAQRLHPGVAAGQQLVGIALVADIPYELIPRRLEGVVQCDRELHDAQSSADVAASARAHVDQPRAHLLRECGELCPGELPEIGGRMDLIEQRHGCKL